jgi:hypothetical protein
MRRFLPLSGVVLVVLIVAAVLLGGSSPPSNTASGAEVADYYDAHQARMFVVSLLFPAAGLFAVTFAAAVGRALGSAEPVWERVLHAGGVVFATALGLVGALTFALADSPTKISEQSLQALNLLQSDLWIFWNAAMGIFMLGAAASWLASPHGRRPLGWVALVLGVALFFPFADFFAFLASGLWIVVASLLLFGGERAPAYRPAARTA